MNNAVVTLTGITKYFPGVIALNNVSFTLRRGEVHVLLGENGAGKSTLINVLGGIVQPDKGEIFVKGQTFSCLTPQLAQKLGIGLIHQELSLIPQLSVAENIFLGRMPSTNSPFPKVNWNKVNQDTKYWLNHFGVDINPTRPVRTLSIAMQQAVEITKVLSLQAEIIVMDEPTSSLSNKEVENLFQMIEELKSRGCSIIYISHRMNELKRVGDRVTVLKDGAVVGTEDVATTSIDTLVQMMVGRRISRIQKKSNVGKCGPEILKVENLSSPGKIKNVSFSVHAGEVLGIGGIVGAGRTELVKAIFGADPASQGNIYLEGSRVRVRHPQDAIRHGICLVPEDRRIEGLILRFPVRINLSLPFWQKKAPILISRTEECRLVERCRNELRIKTPHCEVPVTNLSGGNQQKVVIGKWLNVDVKVLIFDEPTRGVDVGSKQEIQNLIRDQARKGKAVIVISSELPELLSISDRILVMYDGSIIDSFMGRTATEEDIIYCATTGLRRN